MRVCLESFGLSAHWQDVGPSHERRRRDKGLAPDRHELFAFPLKGYAAQSEGLRRRLCRGLLVQLDKA